MFGLSLDRLLVLGLLAMFVLGPERLPAAAAWLGRTLRQIKSYAAGANEQLRREVGPELDQLGEPLAALREPLQQLRAPLRTLRGVGEPRTALTRYLLSEPELHPSTTTTKLAETGASTMPAGPEQPGRAAVSPPIDPDAT